MRLRISNCEFRIWHAVVLLALFAAVPLYGYVTSKQLSASGEVVQQKWKSFPITWQMNPARGANVSGSREMADVFRQSFAAWQGVSTASISFTEGSASTARPVFDQINLISTDVTAAEFASGALGLTAVYSFIQGGPGFVDQFNRPIEFAGQIVEADIMFNPANQFTTSTTAVSDRYDLQSVATHEVGHLLGMDHSPIISATMFPTVGTGFIYPRALTTDDVAGVATIYNASATRGKLTGTVRTTSNAPVYGAIVVAVNSNGQPVASAITNPSGTYTIEGLDAGAYTVYAEPMDEPYTINNIPTLTRIYAGQSVNSSFTTRFR